MKNVMRIVATVLACVVVSEAAAASSDSTELRGPCTLTNGQLVALATPIIVKNAGLFDGSLMGIYNQDKNRIELRVYGAKDGVDGARAALEAFRLDALKPLIATIVEMFGVYLSDSDFTLVYLNRYKNNREIVRYEDRQYIIK